MAISKLPASITEKVNGQPVEASEWNAATAKENEIIDELNVASTQSQQALDRAAQLSTSKADKTTVEAQGQKLSELEDELEGMVKDEVSTDSFAIADSNGNTIARFVDGHIITQNFDSKGVNIDVSKESDSDFAIADPQGRAVMIISGGHIHTKAFSSDTISTKKPIRGRQVIVERFGGEGNDWCFVRTPDGYAFDGTPCRMVICNHGNGWLMDGSLAYANFSAKTQFGVDDQNDGAYLDTTRADYVQYSSPLIEALLAQGYVVCGAENYGDQLYGNNQCRNACVDFYAYMLRNYNVMDRCYMIGASNGCMTSLNASYLLGAGKVSAMALLYPLCDLFDHYLHHTAHQSGIKTAYGVGGKTFANLAALKEESAFYTHCPVHHAIVGDDIAETQVKSYPFPPMLLIASGGDTTTELQYNAAKLKGVCDRSSLVCDLVDIDPNGTLGYDHGDWHHFRETDIINFFNNNR